MKTQMVRNAVLALAGLLALTLYILACTSFSPDDTKVLYPTFDPSSGAVGIAVYDRETGRSETLFVPVAYEGKETNTITPLLLRSQWLADGRNIVLAWPAGDGDNGLNLAMLPWPARAPVRLFSLPSVEQPGSRLMFPLCIVGHRLFVMETDSQVLRVDLRTGDLARHKFDTDSGKLSLLEAPDGSGVLYLAENDQSGKKYTFGRLNLDMLALMPLMTFTNEPAPGSFLAFDGRAQRVAFVQEHDDQRQLLVLEKGAPVFTRPLGAKGEKRDFGSAAFSPRGDAICASFAHIPKGGTNASYGLVEIPLSDAPVRQVTLLSTAESGDDANALLFQAGISHDGATAAAASTYLACQIKELKPEDCALFLVDLKDPELKAAKVPIPMPPRRPATVVK
jgi:hypothetical protein